MHLFQGLFQSLFAKNQRDEGKDTSFNQTMLRINDQLLLNLNKPMNGNLFTLNDYVDARVYFDISKQTNSVAITFVSVLNQTVYKLGCVYVLIDVFEQNKWIHRSATVVNSRLDVIDGCEEKFCDELFEFEFDSTFDLDNIELNVYIIGNVLDDGSTKRILGGAHLVLKEIKS